MDNNLAREGWQDQSLSIDRLENDRMEFRKCLRLQFEKSSWPKAYLLAEAMRMDPGRFSDWLNGDFGPGVANMPGDRISAWTELVGPGLLRWLAHKAGYDLVPRDSVPGQMIPSVERLLASFTREAGAAVGTTLDDIASNGSWTRKEKSNDLALWQHLQHLVNSIVDVLQREATERRRK